MANFKFNHYKLVIESNLEFNPIIQEHFAKINSNHIIPPHHLMIYFSNFIHHQLYCKEISPPHGGPYTQKLLAISFYAPTFFLKQIVFKTISLFSINNNNAMLLTRY
mmetsp:Transcript_19505/g.24115  ORF Transcript_19505/g.24115 Transcript_19505/m.24115 type:complete len:107 (-) Transcript_19505:1473-1793(-)